MADTVVHIGEDSPEHVAYKLMHEVMRADKRQFNDTNPPGRAYLLKAYYDCWLVVRGSEPPK